MIAITVEIIPLYFAASKFIFMLSNLSYSSARLTLPLFKVMSSNLSLYGRAQNDLMANHV